MAKGNENVHPDFHNEVKDTIKGLNRKQIACFVWTCAIMALPFLSVERDFAYWKKPDRQRHLFAIFKGIDISGAAITDDHIVTANATFAIDALFTANATFTVANATFAAANAAFAAANAAFAAASATFAATSVAFYNATSDAASAADAVLKSALYIKHRESTIKALIIKIIDSIYANKPLPRIDVKTFYGNIYNDFISDLKNNNCVYWADWYDNLYKNGFEFDKDELLFRLNTPDSIQAEGAAAVGKHMLALKDQGKQETKEARIILLGSKGAGKTSLARRLRNAYFLPMPRKEDSTAGVDTFRPKLIENEITHLWDFGGHVIIQSAHKCFMSAECVYVLVLDGRTEARQEIEEYRKWLTTVKSYSGGNAKVFIVLNESDSHSYLMPEEQLMGEFPNLIAGFAYINLKRDRKKLRKFKGDLKKYIETNLTRKLPAKYFSVKQEFEHQFKKHRKEI